MDGFRSIVYSEAAAEVSQLIEQYNELVKTYQMITNELQPDALDGQDASRQLDPLPSRRHGMASTSSAGGLDSRQRNLGYMLTGWDFSSFITKSALACH